MTVDAIAPYALEGGYFFKSPTGSFMCGILTDNPRMAGCQATVPVANLPQCNRPTVDSAAIISVAAEGSTELTCTTQGVFVRGVPKVLPYGHLITDGNFTCLSRAEGVSCGENGEPIVAFASRGRMEFQPRRLG